MEILTLLSTCAGRIAGRAVAPCWTIGACLFFGSGAAAAADAVVIPEGELLLEMVSKPRWRFGTETQQIKTPPGTSNCSVLADPHNLVRTIGLADGAGLLNTNNKKLLGIVGSGVNCGRIGAGQSLELALSGTLASKVVSAVDLALNVKFNAVARADVYLDQTPVETFRLYTGQSIPASLAENEASCAPGADSSPDNDATNCRWAFSATGNRLVITIENDGKMGVGGLGSTSTLQIGSPLPATGELDCGDTTEIVEFENTPEGANAFVQCRRLDNIDESAEACDVVPYSLTASCDPSTQGCGINLLHANEPDDPFNSEKFAFVCETWWPEQTGAFLNGSLELPKTQQFFGFDDLPGTDLDFCEGVTPVLDPNAVCSFDSGGNVSNCPPSAIDSVEVPPLLDHQTTIAGQQLGCLLDQRAHQVEDAERSTIDVLLKLYQLWYLQGDYTALRGLR